MDGALNHSEERFPKDAVLVSVFTGFVWRDGLFVFKNKQFSQNYPDSSWLELRLGNNDFAHAAHFLAPFFASLQNCGVISRFIENVNKRRQISLCPFERGTFS